MLITASQPEKTLPPPARAVTPPVVSTSKPDPSAEAGPVRQILFGRDERGRPHGASLVGRTEAALAQAARLMGLHRAIADTPALREIADRLPAGRLFLNGRAFVPLIELDLYKRLLAATRTPDTPMPARASAKPVDAAAGSSGGQGDGAPAGGAGGAAKPPFDWADIGLGSLVLARGDEEDDGYYVATVIATKADDHFVLRWRDYPDLLEFSRHRHALGLLHPGAATKGL